jgi:uncharacterized glyoxalase superfamily metalloenzyme YdcJ
VTASTFVSTDTIRALFSSAMSEMYRSEVPQYGALLDLVKTVNQAALARQNGDAALPLPAEQLGRLEVERHGAIRVGTAQELATIRRLFAVMGMQPVGYYDLSVAGVPVHSTAFRPIEPQALARNPFRVFSSLLRLELIEDAQLRATAQAVLEQRSIFTPRCLALIEQCEREGGLDAADARAFVTQALETFRWHHEATVSAALYQQLRKTHPLVADVVCFKGPHINHLTPRTLDIDAAQAAMPAKGIHPKAVIEGPPRRACPVLLRQTSFLALNEPVAFPDAQGAHQPGTHTARFGEIEQRGIALTPRGRAVYDRILAAVRADIQPAGDGSNAAAYVEALQRHFQALPDDAEALRKQGLAFFRYQANPTNGQPVDIAPLPDNLEALVEAGLLRAEPIVYEDFLPVSAAGIFQSNLGDERRSAYVDESSRRAFEAALGAPVIDEMSIYAQEQAASIADALRVLCQRAAEVASHV